MLQGQQHEDVFTWMDATVNVSCVVESFQGRPSVIDFSNDVVSGFFGRLPGQVKLLKGRKSPMTGDNKLSFWNRCGFVVPL